MGQYHSAAEGSPVEAERDGASHNPGGSLVAEPTPVGVAFRATPAEVAYRTRCLLAAGLACPVALAAYAAFGAPAWDGPPRFPIVAAASGLFLCGSFGVAAAVYRSAAATPLVAEPSGRVTYGGRVLLEAGAAQCLYVESTPASGEDYESYRVAASNRWGPVVLFPAHFGAFARREDAVWFARQLGAAIGARVQGEETGTAPEPAAE